MKLVLDSSAVTSLATPSKGSLALMRWYRARGAWPPQIPTVVLVECLTGDAGRDAAVHRLLKVCDIVEHVPTAVARAAARLRTVARRGSAVDALVVALAGPGGVVVTADLKDIRPLAAHAENVAVERI